MRRSRGSSRRGSRRVHELTLSDFDVLVQLYHARRSSAMRRIDLARQVLLTASGITRLLDGLERCGLVAKERCESDARVSTPC